MCTGWCDMTRIIPAERGLEEAAELILKGELVVFPTETVYGLGADAFNASAVGKIYEAKGRPQDNPLIVHVSDAAEVCGIAAEAPDVFYALAEKFMPGPLTVVLPKSDKIPDIVTAGGNTVAVRMPDNVYARRLIAMSRPLAAPSANRSKHVSPTSAQHVYDDLAGRVPLILDGGACRVGIESTVLDLTADEPVILRPGAVTAEMLYGILGKVGVQGKVIKVAKSPGMKYEHYAPAVATFAAESAESAAERYDAAKREGLRPVLLFRDVYRDVTGDRDMISLGTTPEDYMRNIYAALRSAERRYDLIIVETMRGDGIEASVMNRVLKAAGGKTV